MIDQDSLGLDRVYIQAKRYAIGNNIGSSAIRDFFGSLDRHKVGEDHVIALAGINAAEAGRERIAKLNVRFFKLVQIEIEDRDLHHVGIVVVAGEGMLFEKLPLCRFQQRAVDDTAFEIGGLGVLSQNVGIGRNEKTGSAACRVTYSLSRLADQQGRRSNQ